MMRESDCSFSFFSCRLPGNYGFHFYRKAHGLRVKSADIRRVTDGVTEKENTRLFFFLPQDQIDDIGIHFGKYIYFTTGN